MKVLDIMFDERPVATIPVDDCFIWTGTLKNAPEWLVDMVGEGDAMIGVKKMLSIKYKNGYAQADPGDIVIRINKDIYSVIYAR